MCKITNLKKRLLQEVQEANNRFYSPSKANIVAFDNCGDTYENQIAWIKKWSGLL